MSVSVLYDDIFEVLQVDPNGRKFDKVSRVVGENHDSKASVSLDVHNQLFAPMINEKLRLVLSSSIDEGGDGRRYDAASFGSMADEFDYIMHGKAFRIVNSSEDASHPKLTVYVSFGGLLMQLTSEPSSLNLIKNDQDLYLLVKKLIV